MALREILAQFGFNIDQDKLDKADTGIGKLGASMKMLGGIAAAVGAAVVASVPVRFAIDVAVATDEIDKAAAAAGLATRSFSQWTQVVQNNGGSIDDAKAGIKDFSKNLGDAQKGNEDLRTSFRKLGVDLRDSSGRFRDTDDVLEETVLNMDRLGSSARQIQLAEQLFGGASQTFLRIGQGGAEALRQQREEFDRLQGQDFDSFVEESKKAAVALDNWRNATDGLKNRLAGALIPAITSLVDGANSLIRGFLEVTDGTTILQTGLYLLVAALGAVAVAGLIAIAPLLPPILAVAAAIAAVVLVVDDLVALFTGGESAIGRVIDDLFGFGSAQAFVDGTKIAVQGLIDLLTAVVDLLIDGLIIAVTGFADFLIAAFAGINRAIEFFGDLADTIARGFRTAFEAAVNAVVAYIEYLAGIVGSVRQFITGLVATILGAINNIAENGLQGVFDVASKLGSAYVAFIKNVLGGIRDFIMKIVAEVEDAVEFVTDKVDSVVGAAESVGGFFGDVGSGIAGIFSDEPAAAIPATVPAPMQTTANFTGGPVTLSVTGVQDPAEAARQAAALIREQSEEQLRRARDWLHSR